VKFEIRTASPADRENIQQLIAISARELSRGYSSEEQVSATLKSIYGVDSMLIEDGTYFVADADDIIIGCGGWSKRKTLFGGEQFSNRDVGLLDPRFEAANCSFRPLAEITGPKKDVAPRHSLLSNSIPFRDSSRWRYGTVIFKTCPSPLGGGPKPTLET
jgi:hypothetical protein